MSKTTKTISVLLLLGFILAITIPVTVSAWDSATGNLRVVSPYGSTYSFLNYNFDGENAWSGNVDWPVSIVFLAKRTDI